VARGEKEERGLIDRTTFPVHVPQGEVNTPHEGEKSCNGKKKRRGVRKRGGKFAPSGDWTHQKKGS